MNILILGGMHGNEPLGIQLVTLLKQKPIPGVSALIANPRAVRLNGRFSESDLNRSFGAQFPGTYETRRARRLAKLCGQYDLVLDFHNTQSADNDCSFVGPDARPELFGVAPRLGVERCIVADYDCINKACGNVLSIEISLDSLANNPEYWYGRLQSMSAADGKSAAGASAPQLQRYRFARRVTWADKDELDLDWRAFQPIGASEKKKLGLDGIIVPIFVGSRYTEYYATLISLEV